MLGWDRRELPQSGSCLSLTQPTILLCSDPPLPLTTGYTGTEVGKCPASRILFSSCSGGKDFKDLLLRVSVKVAAFYNLEDGRRGSWINFSSSELSKTQVKGSVLHNTLPSDQLATNSHYNLRFCNSLKPLTELRTALYL